MPAISMDEVKVLTINYSETSSNTITDLTGCTWVGNNSIVYPTDKEYGLNFESNNFNFLKFEFSSGNDMVLIYRNLTEDVNQVAYNWDDSGWTDSAYRTIQIIGGTDATNAELIAWLEANGTLTAPISTSLKVLKFNNKIVSKFNGKNLSTFNGENIMSGITAGLISFNIGSLVIGSLSNPVPTFVGDSYQATSGMTWSQWVNSPYNTDGYVIYDGGVYSISYMSMIAGEAANDVIVDNQEYTIVPVSGGSNL